MTTSLFEFLSNCSYTVSKSELDIVTMDQYVKQKEGLILPYMEVY